MSIIRPHKKSRDGCEGCKRRKIKCDEVHPSCTFCSSRRVQCVYPVRTAKATRSPAGSSPNASSSANASPTSTRNVANPSPIATQLAPNTGLKMGELRLMHNYSVVLSPLLALTPLDVNDTAKVWQLEIPRMAFEHEFLMHTMLCISSHHLQFAIAGAKGDASSQVRETDHQLDTALVGYRNAIANLNPNNIEAVLAASLIMVVLSTRHYVMHMEGDLWVVSFLGLHAGMQSLEAVYGKDKLSQSSLYPLLSFGDRLAEDPSIIPPILEEMLQSPNSANLDQEQLQTLYKTLYSIGKLYGLLGHAKSRRTQGEFFIKVMASGKSLPGHFVTLIRQRLPQALIILAHYLTFLKIPAMHGFLAENIHADLNAIISGLEPHWKRYVETPACIYGMQDPREVTMQLLLQLPAGIGKPMLSSALHGWLPDPFGVGTPMSPSSASPSPSAMGGRVEELSESSSPSVRTPNFELPVHFDHDPKYMPESIQTRPSDHSPGGVFEQSPPTVIL